MCGCRKSVIVTVLLLFATAFILAASAETMVYTGDVYSAFVHPLIIYPEKAFSGSGERRAYFEDWFITVDEFRAILNELYARNFILVKPSDVCTYNAQTKTVEKKRLYVPEGKIPLLFSVDDLNYYNTMKDGGTNLRLVFDSNDKLAAEIISPSGETIVSRATECMFIIDDFVAAHPDFSYNGAKGVIAITGYNGIFGYNTHNPANTDYEHHVSEAKKIANAFKKNGWEFASHGYAHLDSSVVTDKQLAEDCLLWKKTVESIIGTTPIFIYPHGAEPTKKENFQELLNAGFYVFFGVGEGIYNKWRTNHLLIRRREFDGVYFRSKESFVSPFFDVTKVTTRYKKP